MRQTIRARKRSSNPAKGDKSFFVVNVHQITVRRYVRAAKAMDVFNNYIFNTYDVNKAIEEAERLAKKQNESFVILRAVGIVKPVEIVTTLEEIREWPADQ